MPYVSCLKLGEMIVLLRESKRWTLRQLEAKCGVSNALISQIETGKVKDPGFSTMVKIADALSIPVERFAAAVRPAGLTALRTDLLAEGHCELGNGCVCGGDTQQIREKCHNWQI